MWENQRRYAKRHPQRVRRAKKNWRKKHGAEWRKKNRISINAYRRKVETELRKQAIIKLGGRCANPACQWLNADGSRGCIDIRCLHIDHVYNNGNKERKAGIVGWKLWKTVLADTAGNYQLLCANCNWIKRCSLL